MASSGTRRLATVGQRMLAAGLVSAVISLGAAGCRSLALGAATAASAGPSATASTMATTAADPQAALTAAQIAARAVADLKAAASVHVTGSGTDSGQQVRLSLWLARGKGCRGRITLAGKGSFRMIVIGTVAWIRPDVMFWKTYGGANAAALKLLTGKWLKTTSHSSLGPLEQLCRTRFLARNFQGLGALVSKASTTMSGQPAVQLTARSKAQGAMYVSDSSNPEILRVIDAGAQGGQLDFTGYGAPVSLSTPPPGQVLDGKRFGF